MGYLAEIWCTAMHSSLMWPSHGHYHCRTCGREYPVAWEHDVTNTPWRQRNEKLVDSGMLLGPGPTVQAAQVTRPS